MAIYKSSFNKKAEKPAKQPKKERIKPTKTVGDKTKIKINVPVVLFVLFAVLFIFCCVPTNFVKSFVLGTIGLSVYPICVIGALISLAFASGKHIHVKRRYVVYLTISLCIVWFIVHLILTSKISLENYGQYLADTYLAKTTAGGVLFSLISYPLVKFLSYVGAYIFSAIALAIFVGLIIDYINVDRTFGHQEKPSKFDFKNLEDFTMDEDKPLELSPEEAHKKESKRKLGLEKGESTIISSNMPNVNVHSYNATKPLTKREYILTPLEPVIPPETTNDLFLDSNTGSFTSKKMEKSPVEEVKEEPVEEPTYENYVTDDVAGDNTNFEATQEINADDLEDDDIILGDNEDFDESTYSEIGSTYVTDADLKEEQTATTEDSTEETAEIESVNLDGLSAFETAEEVVEEEPENDSVEEIEEVEKVDLDEHEYIDEYADNIREDNLGSTVETEVVRPTVDISKFHLPDTIKKSLEPETEQVPAPVEQPKVKEEIPPYVAPTTELLNYIENTYHVSEEELQENIERLEGVLEDFKVPAKVQNVQVGPAVTRYELTMPRGISVNKISSMADDIAMTLASNGKIRVEAPIPGKSSVGIEVPNAQITSVSLRELLESEEFKVRANPLSFVLGKDINGDINFCNLDKMPHLLVAGSTGSGKSVCLNAMLLSICYKAGPQDVRFILIDPKMVEFSKYNGLPHLLMPEIITNSNMAVNALDWAIAEMQRRYELLKNNNVSSISEYNKLEIVKSKKEEKLPYIIIVVDELYDLMTEAKRAIEDRIGRLAAKARAAGIHLVLATQRPSVDVITGTIKSNLPSRIAFALTNYQDSKTVLDGGGAESLLGKGDMLFKAIDKPEPRRIQGAFASNDEILRVIEFIKQNNKPVYDDDAGRKIANPHEEEQQIETTSEGKEQTFDPVLKDALYCFIQNKQASASMISRRFSVGFNRAARIMDQMEAAGFIGPSDGAKPRNVRITMEEFKEIFGDDENA